jgi:hypothetical protein
MGGGDKSVPAAPDYAKLYQKGIDVYLKNLPTLLGSEQDYRSILDPQRVADQQALQDQFGATQYKQQLDALHQLDPESAAIRAQLAKMVSADLDSGYALPADYDKELTNQFRGAQSARGNILGDSAAGAETMFKGQAALALRQQHLQNAGSFLSGPTPEQQLLAVQGVQPDRSSAYVNPGAGTAGANFGLQSYQDLLAKYQLQQNNNPWTSALGGAAAGASAGSAAGPYGALIGGVAGGALGYFGSDERLKTDVREIAKAKSGIPLIRFKYIGSNRLFIGARAQDVQKISPDAVMVDSNGYLKVNYGKLSDVPFFELGAN